MPPFFASFRHLLSVFESDTLSQHSELGPWKPEGSRLKLNLLPQGIAQKVSFCQCVKSLGLPFMLALRFVAPPPNLHY